jgi:hypothetical protein
VELESLVFNVFNQEQSSVFQKEGEKLTPSIVVS